MRIEKRTMNWLLKEPLWQEQKRIAARNRAHTKRFLENQTLFAGTVFSTMDGSRQAETNLILQAAAKRVTETAKQKGVSKLA